MTARVMLVLPTRTYRAAPFLAAAGRLGVEVAVASDEPSSLQAFMGGRHLTLDLGCVEEGVERAAELARSRPLDAVVGVDETSVLMAAHIARRLGLRHSPVEAVAAARDKRRLRRALTGAGLRQPAFAEIQTSGDTIRPAGGGLEAGFPCVVKPVDLSGSRGVIRADGPEELARAVERAARICGGPGPVPLLVESYVSGPEVAVEAILDAGRLHVITIFDKPDPLEGPFFEETLYVTPSRLGAELRARVQESVTAGARALGLTEGPVHAELRLPPEGPVVIELAARSIGGLCSQVVHLRSGAALEEVILAQALGRGVGDLALASGAAGVLMIPIPAAGTLLEVAGQELARAVPGIDGLSIAARPGDEMVPLPEGDRYLGFVFARGDQPAQVEAALREAHRRLDIRIRTLGPPPSTGSPPGRG